MHRILKILLVSDLLIALVLAWQTFDTNLHFGKAWIFYHTEALMLMGGAQFGRHLAYWLYCYELLKVGKLMPQIINRDFSSGKDPMLNFQKKKTRQSLQSFNVGIIVLFASVIGIHMASSAFSAVMLTYVPQIIEAIVLGTALVSIRGCLNQLGDVYKQFAANETKMYL